MSFIEEENFPRGGKKPKIKPTLKRPKEDDNVRQSYYNTFVQKVRLVIIFIVIPCGKCSKTQKGEEG